METPTREVWARLKRGRDALCSKSSLQRLGSVMAVVLIGAAGSYLLVTSHASTPTASLEAEAGTVSGGAATIVSDSTASGTGGVKFKASASGFVHPGVLLSKAQLDAIKAKMYNTSGVVTAPWSVDWSRIPTKAGDTGRIPGAYPYTPVPHATIDCTSSSRTACADMDDDAVAAYTQALLYYYSTTSDRAKYAGNAIDILNAYSSTVTAISGNQSRLETGWAAANFAAAAEIVRYTYTPAVGQSTLNIAALTNLFNNIFVPNITTGDPTSNGNWELAMAQSLMGMGVFTENRTVFDQGVSLWRARVPAYIYLTSDGNQPVYPPGGKYNSAALLKCFWVGAGTPTTSCTVPAGFTYVNGMVQESCRDMSHVTLGLNMMMQGAETAYIQGVDLFNEQKTRIIAGYEFTSKYNQQAINTLNSGGTAGTVDSNVCGGTFQTGGVSWKLGWEIGYNHYAELLGLSMPYTKQYLINNIRNSSFRFGGGTAWQTLTYANGTL